MKSTRTKALDISKNVKDKVWSRDCGRCIICGTSQAMPNAHYIARSQGGLGIEQNIVTLCLSCHRQYDQTVSRKDIKDYIANYLKLHYNDWNEEDLYYKKRL